MGLTFNGTSDALYATTGLTVTTPSLSVCVWLKTSSLSNSGDPLIIFKNDFSSYILCQFGANTSGRFNANITGTDVVVAAGGAFSTGAWSFGCVTMNGTDTIVYGNGGNGKTTNSGSLTVSGLNRISVGCFWVGSYAAGIAADIAEISIYDAVLSDAEVAQIAGGTSPTSVKASNLKHYIRMTTDVDPEPDSIGSLNLPVISGNPSLSSDHPAVSDPGGATSHYLTLLGVGS